MDNLIDNTTSVTDDFTAALCKPLAPEDIAKGQHVAVLYETQEYIDCCKQDRQGPPQAYRLTFWAPEFTAFKVLGVCLPFVLVENGKGEVSTLDTRRVAIARLSDDFARRAMKKSRKSALL